ncbi:MAG TPA: hypothetical protein VMR66_02025 [Gemmatimonadota bacterium]|nr:hypothetical protein [Gemmatimonadota bacterium]
MSAVRSPVVLAALIGLLALGSVACEDLLQEPDTGIATPLTLVVESGDDQTAEPGSTLPAPLRVRLVDLQSHSVERLRVEWVVLAGSGRASPRNTFPDDEGITETTWTLGPEAGLQVVEARVGSETARFEANGR